MGRVVPTRDLRAAAWHNATAKTHIERGAVMVVLSTWWRWGITSPSTDDNDRRNDRVNGVGHDDSALMRDAMIALRRRHRLRCCCCCCML